jgi:hypothetical protein
VLRLAATGRREVMKTVIIIGSDQLEKEHVRALLQAIRDCEMANFPDKNYTVSVEVPELTSEVCKGILMGIKPGFKHGPMIFKRRERDSYGSKTVRNERRNMGRVVRPDKRPGMR